MVTAGAFHFIYFPSFCAPVPCPLPPPSAPALPAATTRQVLAMVQEGKLDVGGNSPQKLCLVAICYHNMAVSEQ